MVNVPVPLSPTPNAGIVVSVSIKSTYFKSPVSVKRLSVIGSENAALPLFMTDTLISLLSLVPTTPGLTDWKAKFGVVVTLTENVFSHDKLPLVVVTVKIIVCPLGVCGLTLMSKYNAFESFAPILPASCVGLMIVT